ncbi:MAG: hypothetical protein ACRDMH_04050 [Solirubrobacterales bacterium]
MLPPRSGKVKLCLAAAATGLLFLLAPASPAAGGEFIGINVAGPDQRDLQKIADTEVRSDRFLLSWAAVQPSKGGDFKWGATDRMVGGSASRGIRALPMVWGSPHWAASSPARPPIDTAGTRHAWRAFLEAAVKRYGPGGAYWGGPYHQQFGTNAKAVPITAWQIWTEPNGKAYFDPSPSPRRYARLLQISHDAIKGANSKARVVLAGLVGLRKWHGRTLKGIPGWKYLRELYRVPGVKRNFDIAAVHPYAPNLEQLRREMKLFRAAMRKGGDGHTQLWITELGWGSAPRGSGNSLLGLNKGANGQRQLLAGSFKLILSHRRSWRVGRLYWYDWRDPPKDATAPCSFCETAGLLRNNRKPKPAYRPFARFARKSPG